MPLSNTASSARKNPEISATARCQPLPDCQYPENQSRQQRCNGRHPVSQYHIAWRRRPNRTRRDRHMQ